MFIALPRRLLPITAIASFLILLLLLRSYTSAPGSSTWRSLPLEKIGLGEHKDSTIHIITPGASDSNDTPAKAIIDPSDIVDLEVGRKPDPSIFTPGVPKPKGEKYTKMLITPRTIKEKEKFEWFYKKFPPDNPHLNVSVYIADDPSAPFHVPKNKGHEVMIYLTHIINHYNSLADVNIFMHNHQKAWHNNDLLSQDAGEMLERLSAERVVREGYMNLRCHWQPGCPDWLHPGNTVKDVNKQEEVILASAWSELFPMDEIPTVLAGACCAQFALSRERIRALPLSRYIFFRDWLLRTPLDDFISGRVWEYVWHYLWTGRTVHCPLEHICYCDGYGLCFGSKTAYEKYWEVQHEKSHNEGLLKKWKAMDLRVKAALEEGAEGADIEVPEFGEDQRLVEKIQKADKWLKKTKAEAFRNGMDPEFRAKEVGRPWKEGDGF